MSGTSALNPFDKWTTAIAADDDVVSTCERASHSGQNVPAGIQSR